MKKLFIHCTLLILVAIQLTWAQDAKAIKNLSKSPSVLENRFATEVVNKQNAKLLEGLLGDDFISHHFPMPGQNNKMAFIQGMEALLKAFPDIHIERIKQSETEDKVFTYAFLEGTQRDVFMGIPPSNKKVHVEYMDIWRIADGKLVENWVIMDIMGLMIQLGLISAPGK